MLDDVDNAASLLYVVARFAGPDSATMTEVKRLLLEGHSPKDIAAELKRAIENGGAA